MSRRNQLFTYLSVIWNVCRIQETSRLGSIIERILRMSSTESLVNDLSQHRNTMDHPSSRYKTVSPCCRYLGHPATLFSSTGDRLFGRAQCRVMEGCDVLGLEMFYYVFKVILVIIWNWRSHRSHLSATLLSFIDAKLTYCSPNYDIWNLNKFWNCMKALQVMANQQASTLFQGLVLP